jgi:tetratricopeptide (TPR) repeat protein
MGNLEEAEPLLRQSLDIRLEIYGPESTKVAMVLVSLGRLEQTRGHLEEAEALYTEALLIRRQQLGEDHLHTALVKKDLAALLLDREDPRAAQILLTQALETLYRIRPPGDRAVIETEALLGLYFTAIGQPEDSEPCIRSVCENLKKRKKEHLFGTPGIFHRLKLACSSLEHRDST